LCSTIRGAGLSNHPSVVLALLSLSIDFPLRGSLPNILICPTGVPHCTGRNRNFVLFLMYLDNEKPVGEIEFNMKILLVHMHKESVHLTLGMNIKIIVDHL